MIIRTALALFAILGSTTLAAAQVHGSQAPHPRPVKAATAAPTAVLPTAISGLSSSGRHCLPPAAIGTHYLGWVDQRTRITITFSADFDPVASATFMRFGERADDGLAQGADASDDDSGGGLNPLIEVEAPFGGYLILFVSPYANAGPGGCYFYKVEVRTP